MHLLKATRGGVSSFAGKFFDGSQVQFFWSLRVYVNIVYQCLQGAGVNSRHGHTPSLFILNQITISNV